MQWEKKLENQPAPVADTLVLKTSYNLAWDYFNAHTLGQTIFDYWGEWLRRHETLSHNIQYPAPSNVRGALKGGPTAAEISSITNSRVILLRKRTRNFLDLTNLWKKSVLESLERDVLGEIAETVRVSVARPTNILDYNINTAVVGPQAIIRLGVAINYYEDDSDDEIPHRVNRRSPEPQTSNAWRSGASASWGRGSRPKPGQ